MSGRIVAAAESDSTGRYILALQPGTYTLTATTGIPYPHCQPLQVTVQKGAPRRADINCDTGLR